jgi:hypothetical protein
MSQGERSHRKCAVFGASAYFSNDDPAKGWRPGPFIPYETAINLFCSCASVKPSGACRNKTISDCLK